MTKAGTPGDIKVNIRFVLSILFICGWLVPKIKIGGLNLGIQEIVAVFLLLYRYKINKFIFRFFQLDFLFAALLSGYAFFHLVRIGDVEGVLIGVRTLLFVLAAVSFTGLELEESDKLIKASVWINLLFVIWSVGRILLNILFNSFDPINFFYGSDSYRVRAPFENGGASSQVPIGYMIGLLFCIPYVLKSKFKKITFLLGAIGTTSRAAVLSVAIVSVKKLDRRKIAGILAAVVVLALLLYAVYLKSFMANDGELDGSANKRLDLYLGSIGLMLKNPIALLMGFGISTTALADATGEGFYESFIVNSFMQGGVILLLLSFGMVIKAVYYDFRYNIYSISIVIILGNVVGGSNYFSMYAYPLMALIVSRKIMEAVKKNDEKGITRINIQ